MSAYHVIEPLLIERVMCKPKKLARRIVS